MHVKMFTLTRYSMVNAHTPLVLKSVSSVINLIFINIKARRPIAYIECVLRCHCFQLAVQISLCCLIWQTGISCLIITIIIINVFPGL